ncbi:hypothetical protein Ciccas_013253, partial [Cichlidogyrus casuarinus]
MIHLTDNFRRRKLREYLYWLWVYSQETFKTVDNGNNDGSSRNAPSRAKNSKDDTSDSLHALASPFCNLIDVCLLDPVELLGVRSPPAIDQPLFAFLQLIITFNIPDN